PPTGSSVERPHATTVQSPAAASRYAVNSELPGVFRPRDAPSFHDEQVLDEGGWEPEPSEFASCDPNSGVVGGEPDLRTWSIASLADSGPVRPHACWWCVRWQLNPGRRPITHVARLDEEHPAPGHQRPRADTATRPPCRLRLDKQTLRLTDRSR